MDEHDTADRAIAVVGLGAILPDAPDVPRFWTNVREGRYSISDVTPDRWDPARYFDPDPHAPDKTYSKIGGWVRDAPWDPLAWRLPIPPKVAAAMDGGQQWAIACTREALLDYGWPSRPLDTERTAVILGNAMAGERHYYTALRIFRPEVSAALARTARFAGLPADARAAIEAELAAAFVHDLPEITEDTMPGELANCIAGRIANLFDFHGPNYIVDAACASAMAAMSAAVEGLVEGDFDAVITGGIDRNMGVNAYVKFCKIGALSATGTRPYADGADGFVMGEGAALFLLKRLADAERAGDKIYAVLRGIGGASDGKGKGITAPNPVGQRLAVERAWRNAGLSPATAGLVEGHGTSTKVGDVVEVEGLSAVFGSLGLRPRSLALGSVKSNIGHLKGAAGAAGVLKAVLAVHHNVLPPSIHFDAPNPNIDFAHCPFAVNTTLRDWAQPANDVRRAGVSAFGFGGTNFHVVLEEFVPGRLDGRTRVAVPRGLPDAAAAKAPLRGALVVGADTPAALRTRLDTIQRDAAAGRAPAPAAPAESDLRAPERVAIDYGDAAELADRAAKAIKALGKDDPAMWKVLRPQGVFRGRGAPPRVAFLYPGQGSQYVGMLGALRAAEPLVAETFAEADRVMTPLLGRALTSYIHVDTTDAAAVARADEDLKQTEITQPAVLTVDDALTRLFAAYGVVPDMVMGHSLGEYGALVAAGGLPFADALEAVSARGREMAAVSWEDNGWMAAVLAPLHEVERIVRTVGDGAVIANVNSTSQAVIGGPTAAVQRAIELATHSGYTAIQLPVSHAFHTAIVAPASEPLRRVLARLHVEAPRLPVVANVSGEFYPSGAGVRDEMLDILAKQVASPVQFVQGLETLYAAGARLFVEVGPKRALSGFVDDVLGPKGDVLALVTNHPKVPDVVGFNQALCGLYAAGLGACATQAVETPAPPAPIAQPASPAPAPAPVAAAPAATPPVTLAAAQDVRHAELGRLMADFLEKAGRLWTGGGAAPAAAEPVVISGASLGLPGTERVFDDANLGAILRGKQLIDLIPTRFRRAMLDKHITRLVKSEERGAAFETIDSPADVIKLAARAGAFDLGEEFGVSAERLAALDVTTRLAIGAGLDALRDAGIPLVQHYKTTHKGTHLPDRWGLPDALRDDTGIVFASVFPGYDSFAHDLNAWHVDRARREQLELLEQLAGRLGPQAGDDVRHEIARRIDELRATLAAEPHTFDRRFLFRILSMGHSQLAELIGARGPNTQVNAACASTTQAIAIAEDWIRVGRCRRVLVVAGDDVTSDQMLEWIGAGFLASGAAATDDVVEEAALPFDRRRHGMLLGMGAAGFVVESAEAARERGVSPICEVLSTVTLNSAFHGTRLDVDHIAQVMETMVRQAEARSGVARAAMAPELMFVSHETYTPARGGSAAAEVHALRRVFGADADRIVVTNTKGYTGHPMGAGIEDVVAVKALETGLVPPVANFKEVDPELGPLNLSRGGEYPVRWALRLGAGFGSQISMSLLRWVPPPDGRRHAPESLGYASRIADPAAWQGWLARVTGRPGAQLEITHRTLRVIDTGAPADVPPPQPQPAATPVAQPAPAPAPPPPAAPSEDPVKVKVLAIVAEKTGYPSDMLDLDLDLEADLGVDTVKQAETFAAVRAAWDIPREDKLRLRDFPTLAHVIQFVRDRRPDLAGAAPPPAAAPAAPAAAPTADDPIKTKVLAIVAEKTGYPSDMLDLDLDLEADLGVDTVKQAETFAAVRAAWDIPREDKLRLRDFPTLAHVIQFVRDRRPDLAGAAPPPAAAPAAPAAAPTADDPIKTKVLAIVAEKTGYPSDMLDLDLDLEADLGVDTVKQAETFAAVRAAWDIPREDKLRLRDFPTLAHVIQFVRDRRPDLAGASATGAAPAAPPAPAATAATQAPRRAARLEDADRVPRREPAAVLRPPLARCVPTGVTLAPGNRVVVMTDAGGVAARLVERLGALDVRVVLIADSPDDDTLIARLDELRAGGPVQGVYWLPGLDVEPDLPDLDVAAWRAGLHRRVKLLAVTMRALYEDVAGVDRFLVAGTRLGGRHGYDRDGATAPMGGAVTGFTKAYARERPGTLVKAVDVTVDHGPDEVASLLIDETLHDSGAVEIGYAGGQRWTVALHEVPAADGHPGMTLGPDSVFVVTGAAGSIVAAIIADLAAASGGIFHLLDLVPAPEPDDPDIPRLATDRDGLKRDIADRLRATGERVTPVMVDRQLAGLERAASALAAIEAVRAAGGTAHWHQVDLRDGGAVDRALTDVRAGGRVDVLLHAGGLEISHLLPAKSQNEFDLVFDVKADGWFHLLRGLRDVPLGATVVFSSIAGRFGNGGQTDYAAANDLLCKTTSALRRLHPDTRAIAIDWTAWSAIGMAARGSIPQMMAAAGIDMLAPECGIPVIRRELTAGARRGEILIAQRLGILEEERHPEGGLDVGGMTITGRGPMLERVVGMRVRDGLVVEATLDPATQPFLFDHRIDGTPVLPGVMGIEAFAETATLLLPDWRVVAIEDVSFLAPFKFYRDEPRIVTVTAFLRSDGDGLVADCRLLGSRTLAGQAEPQTTVHFTGRVRLARGPAVLGSLDPPPPPNGTAVEPAEIYSTYFHGPSYRVIERAWTAGPCLVGQLAAPLPPDRVPADAPLVMAPRLIELCFQTAGIRDLQAGRLALPQHVRRVSVLADATEAPSPLQAIVGPPGDGAGVDVDVVASDGRIVARLEGYRTVVAGET